jgi:betaine reductase
MPVIRAVSLVLAHVPSLVRLGSKPLRALRDVERPIEYLRPHLRDWGAACAYAPNQVFIGNMGVDALAARPVPWHQHPLERAERFGPDGEVMPEDEFLGLLAACDGFDLLALDRDVADRARRALDAHPVVGRASGRRPVPAGVAAGVLRERIERHRAVPLVGVDGQLLGAMLPGHEDDDTLTGQVLLENLACKATAALALRHLLARPGAVRAADVRYVISCGEEAVGDRYQRGGGNVAKAVAEWAGCERATGSDVKAFCCGPMHALMLAAALVHAGVNDDVVVLAGGSLAKLGMKFQGHVKHGLPIVEDVLAGFAVHVARDDGVSPVLRLDAIGRHEVASGSAPLAVVKALYTEPAGSGNVPLNNYRTLASLAVIEKLIGRGDIDDFVRTRGMPGFSPTQGHIASAIPYLGHALRGLTEGRLTRTMFTGKGSLFLGRMTQLSDGISLVLERNGVRAGAA